MTVDQVIEYLTQNAEHAEAVAVEAVKNIPNEPSPYSSVLKNAILTDRGLISAASRQKYDLLIGKYLG